jgi:hypothetical protein
MFAALPLCDRHCAVVRGTTAQAPSLPDSAAYQVQVHQTDKGGEGHPLPPGQSHRQSRQRDVRTRAQTGVRVQALYFRLVIGTLSS